VGIKLDFDLKETQTDHVRSKLSEILKLYYEKMLPEKQVGAPTVPLAVIKRFNEFVDFWCHKGVQVSHGVTVYHIYSIPQLANLHFFALSLSYMFILLRALHQMFIDEAAYAEYCTFFLSAQSCTISVLRHHI
jgi:hypothetical protein